MFGLFVVNFGTLFVAKVLFLFFNKPLFWIKSINFALFCFVFGDKFKPGIGVFLKI